MTTMRWIVAVVAVIGLSCGGNGGSTGGGVDVGADVGDADPDTPEAPDTSVEPAPFAVSVQVDRTVGVPGQEFALEATGIDIDTAELTFAWSDGADGPTRTVQFDAPGEYAVGVTATDAAGAEVETGVFLLVFEPGPHFVGDLDDDGTVDLQDRALLAGFLAGTEDLDTETWRRADLDGDLRVDGIDLAWLDDALSASAPAPTRLDPANGSRGTVVSVVHPVLLDPAVTVTIQVGDADPLVPARGLPGRAAFAVPPGLTRPGATEVKILVDGAEAASLPFEILAPPPVGQTPGVRILETHAALDTALEALPELIDEIGAFTELSEEDRGILRGTLLASGDALRAGHLQYQEVLGLLNPETRALIEELSLANGLAEADADLAIIADDLRALELMDAGALTPGASQRVIAIICLARRIADVSEKVATINAKVSAVLSYIPDWVRLVPGVGPILAFLDGVSAIVGTITDIIGTVASFLPDFGESIKVVAMPEDLANGDSAELSYFLPLRISSGLCRGGGELFADAIVTRLRARLIRSIGGRIPVVGHIFRRSNVNRDDLGALEGFIYDRVGDLVDVALDAVGLKAALARIAAGVCRAILGQGIDPELTLTRQVGPEASCGEIELDAWSCNRDCPDQGVVITARANLCGEEISGNTTVTCAGCRAECPNGCCTEDQECIPAVDQTDEQCGAMGAMCGMCGDGQTCSDGECVCASNCTAEQAAQGARMCFPDDVAGLCTEVEPDCFRWEHTDCAAGQAECEDGECTGGCGAWNCEGCCDFREEPTCREGDQDEACGEGGRACDVCNTGDGYQCLRGDCRCTDPRCEGNCPSGCDAGDPHLITLDGLAYDFQAAGEFVLVESTDPEAPFAIQTRQEPWTNMNCPTVAVNTAVAARVGSNRVAIYVGERPSLRVDGAPTALEIGASAPMSDGRVTRTGFAAWTVEWRDGTRLRATRAGGYLDLAVTLSPGRMGRVRGLLGDGDGSVDNDIATRAGEVLEAPVPWRSLHRVFGDSFRVESSLFDYSNGRSTRTYDLRAFPGVPTSADALPVAMVSEATTACEEAGVSDPVLLDACIVDVACSGDPSLALSLARLDPPLAQLEVTVDAPAPTVTSVAPEVALAGGPLYIRGANLATPFGRVDDTQVLATGVDADDVPVELSFEVLSGSAGQVVTRVPDDILERLEGPALITVVTPGGESSAPRPVYFTDTVFGLGDAEPGHGMLGTVVALVRGTSRLPDLADPCNDERVLDTDERPCPITTLLLGRLDVPLRGFSEGFPGVEDLFEYFAIRFEGFLVVETPGQYELTVCSDDGSRVFLDLPGDDFIDIDNDGTHSYSCQSEIANLPAGTHGLIVDYFQGPGSELGLRLWWTPPGEAEVIVPSDNLRLFAP